MNILHKKYVAIPFIAAAAVLIADWILIGTVVLPLASRARDTIVIHFSGYRGIDLVGSSKILVGMLATGTAIVAVNAALAEVIVRRQSISAHLLAYGSAVVSLALLVVIAVVLSVN